MKIFIFPVYNFILDPKLFCNIEIFSKLMKSKVGCALAIVISSDFRMGKHRDDNHEEDAPFLYDIKSLCCVNELTESSSM